MALNKLYYLLTSLLNAPGQWTWSRPGAPRGLCQM